MISETPPESLMNSKAEWGSNSVPRVVVQQEKDKDNNKDRGGTKRAGQMVNGTPGDSHKRRRQNSDKSSKWSKAPPNQVPTFQSIKSFFKSDSLNMPSGVSRVESGSKDK